MGDYHISLDYTPRDWQRECHANLSRFQVLALHRRAGKTELAIMKLIDKSLKFQGDLGLHFYLAPFLKQAKSIAWARLKQKIRPLVSTGGVTINESELTVQFMHNGAAIRLFGADNPDAMRGVRLDGAVIDEVAQIKPDVWDSIIQPALSDRKGWAMFIGTPNGINLFSELYFAAADRPDWHSSLYTCYDTQALDSEEIERLRRDMPEIAFRREYLCDFSASADDQLISLSDCEVAAHRVYTERDVEGSPTILGVDPARFGDDRSVIFRRKGLQAFDPIVMRGLDNMALAGRVAAQIEEHRPDATFIDAGAGAGVIDRLRQLGYDPIEVPFGGKAVQDGQFVNRRCEMWWGMREWIQKGGAIPNDQALKSELSTPVYWFDSQGRKVLESKDEIKKRLHAGASPDMADALALTFAMPVRRSDQPLEKYATRRKETTQRSMDYDPYANSTRKDS